MASSGPWCSRRGGERQRVPWSWYVTGSPSLLPRTQIAQNGPGKCRVSVATNIFSCKVLHALPALCHPRVLLTFLLQARGVPAWWDAQAWLVEQVPRAWWVPFLLILLLLACRTSPKCWCSLGCLLAGAAPLLCPFLGFPVFSSMIHQWGQAPSAPPQHPWVMLGAVVALPVRGSSGSCPPDPHTGTLMAPKPSRSPSWLQHLQSTQRTIPARPKSSLAWPPNTQPP